MSSYSMGKASAELRHSSSVSTSGGGCFPLIQSRTGCARRVNRSASTLSTIRSVFIVFCSLLPPSPLSRRAAGWRAAGRGRRSLAPQSRLALFVPYQKLLPAPPPENPPPPPNPPKPPPPPLPQPPPPLHPPPRPSHKGNRKMRPRLTMISKRMTAMIHPTGISGVSSAGGGRTYWGLVSVTPNSAANA